jgi:hypothetical protein
MKNMEGGMQEQARAEIDSSSRAPDYWRINLAEEWELRFWSREFGCREDELRAAVSQAGTSAGAVRAFLLGRQ